MPPTYQYRERDYEFANTLVTLRSTIGLTQQGLATLLGVSSRAVENWEQGLTGPKAEHLKAFIALGVRAAAFAAGHEEEQIRALWIAAASEEALLASFAVLAELLPGVASQGETDQRKLVAAVVRWLEQCSEPWLLIVDNADDLPLVQPYLPLRGNGSVLLTTRASATGWLAPSLEVDAMGVPEGIELLLRRAQRFAHTTDEEINKAGSLVVALGQFPLALDQAGAYIEETGCSLRDYQELYQTHRGALLARRGRQATGYPASVATTWSLSFEYVEQKSPAAAELLQLRALLAPDHIPEELLTDGAPYWPPVLQQAATDRFRFNQALETLLAFSLVKRLGEDQQISIHRLVQAVQEERLLPEEQRQWAERLVRAVNVVFPREPEEVASWQACSRSLEQVQACDLLVQKYQLKLPEAADLLTRAGTYLRERALYSLAEPLYRRALAIHEHLLGPDHPETATSLYYLALLYEAQRRYEEAEALALRVLAMRERLLGPQHLDTAMILRLLAMLYITLGRYEEAEPFLMRTLAIREQHLGPNHSQMAHSLVWLAILYYYQGKYTQAEPLYQRVLQIIEQQLGPEHPDAMTMRHNLSLLSLVQGRYEEAEQLALRVLAFREQHFGPLHLYTSDILVMLAEIYQRQGRTAEAEQTTLRALDIREHHADPDDIRLAETLHVLALVYRDQGRLSEAEAAFQRALTIREQLLVSTHPDLADTLHGFAVLRQLQGRLEEARSLYERALLARTHSMGEDHPATIDTRERLHTVLGALGQMREAAHVEAAHKEEGMAAARNQMSGE
jgi:tetratricopeptide (TPR) repeat protein